MLFCFHKTGQWIIFLSSKEMAFRMHVLSSRLSKTQKKMISGLQYSGLPSTAHLNLINWSFFPSWPSKSVPFS